MARVTTYLNFPRSTGEAFLVYKSVFKTEFVTPILRLGAGPPCPGRPPTAAADTQLVMHVAHPTLSGHVLTGSDAPESMGHQVDVGDNI